MAAKRRRKKNTNPLRQLRDGLAVVTRFEIVGLALVLVSVFTLLSLLTGSRGSVTGLWIDLLRAATGDGVAGVPLLTGFLGLWMVLHVIDGSSTRADAKRALPILPWRIPAGLLLVFLAYITAITLWLPSLSRAARIADGGAGGAFGLYIAKLLEDGLPGWGAWTLVVCSALLGLALVSGRRLWESLWDGGADMALDGWESLRTTWRATWREGQQMSFPGFGNGQKEDGRAMSPLTPPATPLSPPAHAGPAADDGREADAPELAVSGNQLSMLGAEDQLPARNGRTQPAWELPQLNDMLDFWDRSSDSDDLIRYRGLLLEETLALFGVPADFEGVNAGPTVTQYLIRPGYIERMVRGEVKRTKVKVSKIASLTNDLALALAARTVRIEAPIPGTSYVGIEVPNSESNNVGLKELMESEAFEAVQVRGRLPIALGEDVRGKPVITDLTRMPHLLIAGATGTGKSVCINSIIGCLLLTHTPETLRLLMIDPKMVELTVYNGTPHLLSPVVTDVDRAAGMLFWCIKEMERRYQLLNQAGVRDLERFNAYLQKLGEEILPYIVVVIDEMADLMMAAPEEVEKHVIRLAQMARAVGIHLIIATQRPSVDVITGLIKANFPARIAFAVTSQIDSRVVLDLPGAESLLGRGDMLFMAPDASKLERLQGAFLDDPETNRIVRYWQNFHKLESYLQGHGDVEEEGETLPFLTPNPTSLAAGADNGETDAAQEDGHELLVPVAKDDGPAHISGPLPADGERDELFGEAVQVVNEAGRGTVTILQRKLRVGFNRASRLVGQLEAAGILGPDRGRSQGREVYLQDAAEGDGESDGESEVAAGPVPESVPEEAAPSAVAESEAEPLALPAPPAARGEHDGAPAGNGQAESADPDEEGDASLRIWM